MIFWPVSLDFMIFSISDGFGMVSLWISNPWRDLRPGNVSKSPRGWNFIKNDDFIKDVTGRNKKYQKYQLWACDEFIIPPSSRALALHALIISLEPSGKIVKVQKDCTEFVHKAKQHRKFIIFEIPSPRRLLIENLKLAAPCRRITLQSWIQ